MLESCKKGDQGDGTYINPILAGDYADPTLVRVGNDYYMTHSCFEFAPGFLIWHSTDLVNWVPVARAAAEYTGNVWAPDLTYYNGQFYIYAPINEEIMVLTAPAATGPWSAPAKVGIKGIDPGHVADENGNRYLFYSSGYVVELTEDGFSAKGEPRKAYEGWRFPEEWVVEGRFLESPKLTYRNGYYYLTVAQGGSSGPGTSHMVASARSRSPWGPYEDSPHNPIIRTASRNERWLSKGHGSIVDTPDGEWWLVYHAFEKGYYTLGRQTLLEPLEWTEGGWFRVPDGVKADQAIAKPKGTALPLANLRSQGTALLHGIVKPTGAALPRAIANPTGAVLPQAIENPAGAALPQAEHFYTFQAESGELGYAWSWYKPTGEIHCALGAESIAITPDKNSYPLVFMPDDHAYEARIEIEISGNASGRFVLFYNESTYSGIELSNEGIHGIIRGWRTPAKPWDSRRLIVRLQYRDHEAIFYCSHNGTDWIKFEHSFETSGWHHNALGGFLALRLALWAQGEGGVTYSHFDYGPLEQDN
ncbi:family 43 glycosylhydrolase [Paenibacillus sp. CAU 1782]